MASVLLVALGKMKTTWGATDGGAKYAKYGWTGEENAGAKNGAAEKRGESAYGFQNATLYNGMISPWVNTALRGAVWYQGESNVACNDRWPYMQGVNCAMYVGHTDTYLCMILGGEEECFCCTLLYTL